ncbi:MAG: MarR family transcriptional regulator [Dehalococcoidales bacterium]|nr:MarR family transcriptional regulator [Dehalococcoidales bacterium]
MINIEIGTPVFDAYHLFMQTADAVQKYADSTFYRRAGLSVSKFGVLQILAIKEGSMTPSEIARWILRERHNVTTLVSRMKKEGFVRVEPSATDRRSINIILTEKGYEKLEQAAPVARDIANQVMASMSERSLNSMTKTLNMVRKNAHNGLDELSNKNKKRKKST